MNTKKILLIDDEEDLSKFIKSNLEEDGGFEVYIVTDSRESFDAAKTIKPDLVVLDILMPFLDGFKVLERLKKDSRTASIPVIMLSAKSDDESKLKAARLFDEDYLTKPVETAVLKAKIEEVLKRRL